VHERMRVRDGLNPLRKRPKITQEYRKGVWPFLAAGSQGSRGPGGGACGGGGGGGGGADNDHHLWWWVSREGTPTELCQTSTSLTAGRLGLTLIPEGGMG